MLLFKSAIKRVFGWPPSLGFDSQMCRRILLDFKRFSVRRTLLFGIHLEINEPRRTNYIC
jgi:hypothetical protein